jgi:hypothetical protein
VIRRARFNGVFIFKKECYKIQNIMDSIDAMIPIGAMAKRVIKT